MSCCRFSRLWFCSPCWAWRGWKSICCPQPRHLRMPKPCPSLRVTRWRRGPQNGRSARIPCRAAHGNLPVGMAMPPGSASWRADRAWSAGHQAPGQLAAWSAATSQPSLPDMVRAQVTMAWTWPESSAARHRTDHG
jgi:hypothetical protein